MRNFVALCGVAAMAVAALPASAQVAADDYYPTVEGEVPPTMLPPAPPAGSAPNAKLPPRGADGQFQTPNRDLSAGAAAWHLRAALNVAALGCRDAHEAETVAGYNALLGAKRTALAAADAATRADYRARHGNGWQNHHDGAMTRVYNFFAQPAAQTAFCSEARAVLAEVSAAPEDAFIASAPAALARLEAPFTAHYAAYERYTVALAMWRERSVGPRVVIASSSAAVVR